MFKGIKQGIGIFVGFGISAVFAYTVSGTIKTWTSGETLTAADLNTSIQNLKTAIEGASQYGEASVQGGNTTNNYKLLVGNVGSTTEISSVMQRSGTVKNARLVIGSNTVGADCTVTLQFFVPSGSTTTVTNSNTVTFAASDLLNWKTTCVSGFSNGLYAAAQFEF